MLAAFGRAVERLGGAYVTAEDVGMSVADLVAISKQTRYVAGLPVAEGAVGGDPGPHTSYGVYLGVKAAVKRALGKDSLAGLHIAIQGAGSVAGGLARRAGEGRRADQRRRHRSPHARRRWPTRSAAPSSLRGDIMTLEADVLSPNALGAILTAETIAALDVPIVAGGANNQLATPADGDRIQQRGILYAPDYVINAGGIINVSTEYLGDGDEAGGQGAGSRRSRAGSTRSGTKARDRPATPPPSPTHGAAADRPRLTLRAATSARRLAAACRGPSLCSR